MPPGPIVCRLSNPATLTSASWSCTTRRLPMERSADRPAREARRALPSRYSSPPMICSCDSPDRDSSAELNYSRSGRRNGTKAEQCELAGPKRASNARVLPIQRAEWPMYLYVEILVNPRQCRQRIERGEISRLLQIRAHNTQRPCESVSRSQRVGCPSRTAGGALVQFRLCRAAD